MTEQTIQQVADNTSAGIQKVADTTAQAVDQVAEKAGSLSDLGVEKLQAFFDLAEKVMAQYGGEAVDLGLNVLRIDAFSNMYGELIMLLVIAFTVKPVTAFMKKWFADCTAAATYELLEEGVERQRLYHISRTWDLTLRVFFGWAMGGIYTAIALGNIVSLNLWAWIGIFYPELYAVNKLVLQNLGG